LTEEVSCGIRSVSPKKEVRMVFVHSRGRLATAFFVCQLLLVLHTLPLQAEEVAPHGSTVENAVPNGETEQGQVGIASYYAKRYNGKKTNSGARYNPEKLTAASATLPLGTKVRVVNLATDQEVVVTINDRCRKKKVPFIDLSRAAARKLGFLGKGIARVRIIPLDDDESEEES
jgi:rare lipoprotein A